MLQASEAAGPMVSAVAGSASLIPTPVEVKFSRSATELFTGFENTAWTALSPCKAPA